MNANNVKTTTQWGDYIREANLFNEGLLWVESSQGDEVRAWKDKRRKRLEHRARDKRRLGY